MVQWLREGNVSSEDTSLVPNIIIRCLAVTCLTLGHATPFSRLCLHSWPTNRQMQRKWFWRKSEIKWRPRARRVVLAQRRLRHGSSVQDQPELYKKILSDIRKVPSPDLTPESLTRVLTENISISALTFSLERPSCHVTHTENFWKPRTVTITLWSTQFRSLDLVVWVCLLGPNDSVCGAHLVSWQGSPEEQIQWEACLIEKDLLEQLTPYGLGSRTTTTWHQTSWESSSFLLQKTGCLSGTKQVLATRKIPRELFVSSSQWKAKEIRTGCTQEGANASRQYCFFLQTSSGINHHWKVPPTLRQLILSGYVLPDMPWCGLDYKCWVDFKSC